MSKQTPLLRYPGAKSRPQFTTPILAKLNELWRPGLQYREPFFGGGSIGLKFLEANPEAKAWLSDCDISVGCIWLAVREFPGPLKEWIRAFEPSVEAFDAFKAELLPVASDLPSPLHGVIETAGKKLALHRISYSGLGPMSGGPLGGRAQTGATKIDSRWRPDALCGAIDRTHHLLSGRAQIAMTDFERLIWHPAPALLYLDPPYYVKGAQLYQHAFGAEDHERLAGALMGSEHPFVLSYDDCPEVRELYAWAHIEELPVTYSGARGSDGKNPRKTELIITRR